MATFTEADILRYLELFGSEFASRFLLFVGPTHFCGSYDEFIRLYTKLVGGVLC